MQTTPSSQFDTLIHSLLAAPPIVWKIWAAIIVFAILSIVFPLLVGKTKRWFQFIRLEKTEDDNLLRQKIKEMNPDLFEHFIGNLFSQLGYKTTKVGRAHDGGIDVEAEKDNLKYFIQCKRYKHNKVSESAIRDFRGSLDAKFTRSKGIFVTSGFFTTFAERYADKMNIELIDGDELIRLIRKTNFQIPLKRSDAVNNCPRCNGLLVERHSKFGKFLGCSNYPRCRYTVNEPK